MIMLLDAMLSDEACLAQDLLVEEVRLMTPDQRRAWLLRPLSEGILATTTYTQVRGSGAAAGGLDRGPREPVQGKLGGIVGWRRGQTPRS